MLNTTERASPRMLFRLRRAAPLHVAVLLHEDPNDEAFIELAVAAAAVPLHGPQLTEPPPPPPPCRGRRRRAPAAAVARLRLRRRAGAPRCRALG